MRPSRRSVRGGRTPITVRPTPSTTSRSPSTAGSAPNARRQSPSESTTTGEAPGRSSSSVNTRPSEAEMPSVRKRLAVTAASRARKGAPSPRTEAIPLLKIPDSLKEALHSRYSRYSGAEIQNRSNPIVGNWVATRTNCSGAR